MKKVALLITVLIFFVIIKGFSQDSSEVVFNNPTKIKATSFILPVGFISYGVLALHNHTLLTLNTKIQQHILPNNIGNKIHVDNYLQFAPGVIALGLNIAGIKGAHSLKDAAIIYGLSNVILNGIVIPTKKISKELRPDGSAYSSFPSGHTSEAFASAEFLRMEYKNVSPILGWAGYAMAGMTGYLRMYNNKHWFNDVVAGAGVGIASTKLAYLVYSGVFNNQKTKKYKKSIGLVAPFYLQGNVGLAYSRKF